MMEPATLPATSSVKPPLESQNIATSEWVKLSLFHTVSAVAITALTYCACQVSPLFGAVSVIGTIFSSFIFHDFLFVSLYEKIFKTNTLRPDNLFGWKAAQSATIAIQAAALVALFAHGYFIGRFLFLTDSLSFSLFGTNLIYSMLCLTTRDKLSEAKLKHTKDKLILENYKSAIENAKWTNKIFLNCIQKELLKKWENQPNNLKGTSEEKIKLMVDLSAILQKEMEEMVDLDKALSDIGIFDADKSLLTPSSSLSSTDSYLNEKVISTEDITIHEVLEYAKKHEVECSKIFYFYQKIMSRERMLLILKSRPVIIMCEASLSQDGQVIENSFERFNQEYNQ